MEQDLNIKTNPFTHDDHIHMGKLLIDLQQMIKSINENETDKLSPELLDKYYPILKKGTRWNLKKREKIALLFGAALGQCLENDLGFEWVHFEDKSGQEIALYNPDTEWYAFPLSSVMKRIKSRETNFFVAIYNTFKEDQKK